MTFLGIGVALGAPGTFLVPIVQPEPEGPPESPPPAPPTEVPE